MTEPSRDQAFVEQVAQLLETWMADPEFFIDYDRTPLGINFLALEKHLATSQLGDLVEEGGRLLIAGLRTEEVRTRLAWLAQAQLARVQREQALALQAVDLLARAENPREAKRVLQGLLTI